VGTRQLTWAHTVTAAGALAERWLDHVDSGDVEAVYGIPRGGCPPALLVAGLLDLPMVDAPTATTLVVDDLVDTGTTLTRYTSAHHADALYRKPHSPAHLAPHAIELDGWLVFPWEPPSEVGPEDAVVRLLAWMGEDPHRDGLRDTPMRVVKAFGEMTDGYRLDEADLLGVTFDVVFDELIMLRGVEFTSLCEHHLLGFSGTVDIGYIPDQRVVGISKMARLVDVFAHRLQVQERLTQQIADAMQQHLEPRGVGVVVTAQHSCMGCRGARKPDADLVTSAVAGIIKDDPRARLEFFTMRRNGHN
jgi:GTP cyclohydrolase I